MPLNRPTWKWRLYALPGYAQTAAVQSWLAGLDETTTQILGDLIHEPLLRGNTNAALDLVDDMGGPVGCLGLIRGQPVARLRHRRADLV